MAHGGGQSSRARSAALTRRPVAARLWIGWKGQEEGEGGAQSKWGRHCCRPHSHRRVGVLVRFSTRQAELRFSSRHAWHPMSHAFRGQSSKSRPGARFFGMPKGQIPRLASSPALAPASGIRFHKLRRLHSAGALLGRSACFREAETVRSCGSRSQTVAFRLPFVRPQSRTKLAVYHVDMTSLFSRAIRLAPGLNLRHDVSRKARGQLPTRSLVQKSSLFQGLAAFRSNSFCPEDSLKLRPNPLFGKGCNSDLSTFPPIICGERWTTQRFVALDSSARELTGESTV